MPEKTVQWVEVWKEALKMDQNEALEYQEAGHRVHEVEEYP